MIKPTRHNEMQEDIARAFSALQTTQTSILQKEPFQIKVLNLVLEICMAQSSITK